VSTRDVGDIELKLAIRVGNRGFNAGGDYLHVRMLPDGRVLFLMRWRAAGVQVSVGEGDGYFSDSWLYDAEQGLDDAGWRAALGWDGEGEPDGWSRHVQSGRRRPEGDAAREYIQR
jgi:hypothetical protein